MKAKVLVVAVLVVAAILTVVALVLNQSGNPGPVAGDAALNTQEPTGSPTQSSPGSSPAPTEEAPSAPANAERSAQPGAAPEKSGDPVAEATRPSWNPQPTEPDAELEVPEQTQSSAFALPSSREREPLLDKEPKAGVAQGKLTKGFPKSALLLPDSTTIVKSSVETQRDVVMLGIDGRTTASTEEVLDFYARRFDELDWITTQTQQDSETERMRGELGQQNLTITVRELPTGMRSITVSAVLKVGG